MRMRSMLMVVAAVSLLYAPTLAAQTAGTQPEAKPPDEAADQPESATAPATEEITVVGIAEALQQAVQIKKQSNAVVDAIVAEDVGKLPDKNLAEAVARVPGILINREFGEGERVSLRGAEPSLVRTAVNGHNVASGDWFILDQINGTRSFNYLILPSQIVGSLKVYKSPTADLDEGGVGGTIDVQTRKPLDLKPMSLSLNLQSAYSDLSDKTNPNVEGIFSWKNKTSNVGFLVAAAYQKRELRRDGVEVLGYTTDPASGHLVPDLIGSAFFRQERERKSVNAALQLRPTDRLELNINGLYSKFGADNVNSNYLAWTSNALGGGGSLSNATVVGDTAVAGVISSANGGTTGRGVVYDFIDRPAEAKTQFIDLDGNYTASDTWLLHFDLGYTKAKGITDKQRLIEFGAPAAFRFDLRGSSPQVTFLNVDPNNPRALELDFGNSPTISNDDDETYAYLDAEKVLDLPTLKSIKFGVKYTDHERVEDNLFTTYGGFFIPILNGGCGGHACSPSDFFGGSTPSDYLDAIASGGTLDRYWLVNRGTLASVWGAAPYGTRLLNPAIAFSVEETTYGGFGMANFQGARWRGNAGLRVVRTDQTSGGNALGASGTIENIFSNYTPVKVERSYNDYLPSLNFAYDLSPDLLLRVAAARTMARPNYLDVAPSVNLNEGALSGQGGDPNLDPFRANQLDVSLERYLGKDGIYSGAVFYKDIVSFITDRLVRRPFLIETNTPNLSRCTPAPTAESPNRHSCLFDINQRTNGGGGSVKGVELNVLQPLGGGFGFQANYTYSDAEADDPGQFIPGNSKHSGNLVGFFENARVGARVAYSYRSEFLVQFDRSTRLFQEALKSLDASLSYKLWSGLSLSLDGVNLTNEEIRQFATDEFRPRAVYTNGRYFFAGVRWNRY